MSIQYGSLYVDEQYKATVLPNLFYKTWLVPGVVCSKRLLYQSIEKSLKTHNLNTHERSASYEKKRENYSSL